MHYEKFLELARKYKGDQANQEYKFLELLIEQEADVLNWKHPRTSYKTWSELLRSEQLCTPTLYQNYKKARSLISDLWIGRFGAYASISIAKLDSATREAILAKVKKWYGEHKVPPTYQRVAMYVRDMGTTTRKTKRDARIQKMRAYILVCQGLLKKHKIPVPKETWT